MAVIIKVRGGSVETVHANNGESVYLIDYDNHDNMDFKAKLEQLPTEPITKGLARRINLLLKEERLSTQEKRVALARRDAENWDDSTIYDVALEGCVGYNNMIDEEVEAYYSDMFGE